MMEPTSPYFSPSSSPLHGSSSYLPPIHQFSQLSVSSPSHGSYQHSHVASSHRFSPYSSSSKTPPFSPPFSPTFSPLVSPAQSHSSQQQSSCSIPTTPTASALSPTPDMSESLNSLIRRSSNSEMSKGLLNPVNYRPSILKKPSQETQLPPIRSVLGDLLPQKKASFRNSLEISKEKGPTTALLVSESRMNSFSDPGSQSPTKSFRPFSQTSLGDSSPGGRGDPLTGSQSAATAGVRACTVCGVTSTPRWRKGPRGRQSLCNSCGLKFIRKMKKEAKNREKREIR